MNIKSMVRNLSIAFTCIAFVTICCSYKKDSRIKTTTPKVVLKFSTDTVFYDPNKEYMDQLPQFELVILNTTKNPLKLQEERFIIGYEGDVFNDYYLEVLRETNEKKVTYNYSPQHYMEADLLLKSMNLLPGNSISYPENTYLYQLVDSGRYYVRAVFVNKYSFLGKSNIDSLTVIVKNKP